VLHLGKIIVSGFTVLLLMAGSKLYAGDQDTSDQVPQIFATSWGETLALDGSGFYNEIAADVLETVQGQEAYKIMPYKRAKLQFFQSDSACLYPSSLPRLAEAGEIRDPENYIESDGLFAAKTHLFVRPGTEVPKTLVDISGKTIAYPSGSLAGMALDGYGARLIGVNSEQDKAQMLMSGRVDMITGMMPDTAIVFAKMHGGMPVFDPSLVLYEVSVTFVCKRSLATETFIASVNDALKILSQDTAYSARLQAAASAEDALIGLNGGRPETGTAENDSQPQTTETPKPSTKSRNGRRLPRWNNH